MQIFLSAARWSLNTMTLSPAQTHLQQLPRPVTVATVLPVAAWNWPPDGPEQTAKVQYVRKRGRQQHHHTSRRTLVWMVSMHVHTTSSLLADNWVDGGHIYWLGLKVSWRDAKIFCLPCMRRVDLSWCGRYNYVTEKRNACGSVGKRQRLAKGAQRPSYNWHNQSIITVISAVLSLLRLQSVFEPPVFVAACHRWLHEVQKMIP